MTPPGHLVYAADVPPAPGAGGRIVVDRHLRRLAKEGWQITVVTSSPASATPGPWRWVAMPHRRWWWPPFRPVSPPTARLREFAWRIELSHARITPARAILTVCPGPMSWLANSLADRWRCPLVAIVHDWWRETGSKADTVVGRHVCSNARTVFATSFEMQQALATECSREIEQIYPLAAARERPFAAWRQAFTTPSLAHVGTLHPYHVDFLAMVAGKLAALQGRLLVLCPRNNPSADLLTLRCTNLIRQDFFPDNGDALDWIAQNASAMVVMYPFGRDTSGQCPTGFPSRFVEFSQLGLPALLAAPAGNPLRSWADRRAWIGSCAPTDEAAIGEWIRTITAPTGWQALATQTQAAATGDFDPDRTHAALTVALHRPPGRA